MEICVERREKGEGRMTGWEEERDIDEENGKKKRLRKRRRGQG